MSQTATDASERILDSYQQIKSVASVCVNNRECNTQKHVHYILAGQCLRKTFPGVISANNNLQRKRYESYRDEKDMSELL